MSQTQLTFDRTNTEKWSQLLEEAVTEPGEEVFHQGDLGDRMYIIVNGNAEVVRVDEGIERSLATLGPGEYFGEMALLRQSTRSATVRCTAPMDALSLPKREFSILAAYLPQVRESLETVTEQRARANAQGSRELDKTSVASLIG